MLALKKVSNVVKRAFKKLVSFFKNFFFFVNSIVNLIKVVKYKSFLETSVSTKILHYHQKNPFACQTFPPSSYSPRTIPLPSPGRPLHFPREKKKPTEVGSKSRTQKSEPPTTAATKKDFPRSHPYITHPPIPPHLPHLHAHSHSLTRKNSHDTVAE